MNSIVLLRFIPVKTAMTMKFNDIAMNSETNGVYLMPSSYKGFIWAGFSYMPKDYAKSTYPGTGYATAFTAGGSQYIIWSSCFSSIRTERANQVFNMISLEVCAVYSDHVNLTIIGHRNSTKIYELIPTLSLGKPQSIELCWIDIDMLSFQPNVTVQSLGQKNAPHFILTSLTITSSHH